MRDRSRYFSTRANEHDFDFQLTKRGVIRVWEIDGRKNDHYNRTLRRLASPQAIREAFIGARSHFSMLTASRAA